MRLLVSIALFAVTTTSSAQQMPDPSQMAGRPLPAPELPTGTVSVRVVRERMGNNIPDQMVLLIARDRQLKGSTDAQGRVRFDGVPGGTLITVQAIVDGETLRSQEFAVPADGGVRVALIAGIEAAAARERATAEAAAQQPARAGIVSFGGETRIILEFQNDNLQVFYLLDIVNGARTPIDVGEPLIIQLPDGATGAGAMKGSSTLAMVQGDRIRITGPFPPGTTQVQVGYRLPYSDDRVTVAQRWPAAIEQLFVAAEKVGDLRVGSPQLSQQQEATASGSPFIMATGGRLNAGDTLTLTLTGLPHRSRLTRNVGVGIGLMMLTAGFWAALSGRGKRDDLAAELIRRREKLYADLVTLEEQRQQGRLDERRYASRRQSLMTQLERVLGELDRTPDDHRTTHSTRGGDPGGGGEGAAA